MHVINPSVRNWLHKWFMLFHTVNIPSHLVIRDFGKRNIQYDSVTCPFFICHAILVPSRGVFRNHILSVKRQTSTLAVYGGLGDCHLWVNNRLSAGAVWIRKITAPQILFYNYKNYMMMVITHGTDSLNLCWVTINWAISETKFIVNIR